MLLASDKETKQVADGLLKELTKQVSGDLKMAASALAQALLQLQQGSNAVDGKELTNEQRTAG
ncbi:TPA: hypothetical protein ACUT46_003743 [Pseudomonas aeruginosa]